MTVSFPETRRNLARALIATCRSCARLITSHRGQVAISGPGFAQSIACFPRLMSDIVDQARRGDERAILRTAA
jgi:hypothetical protein